MPTVRLSGVWSACLLLCTLCTAATTRRFQCELPLPELRPVLLLLLLC
jgi:hypothetical protein